MSLPSPVLCGQAWGVLAGGNEATQTLGTRVSELFNLPKQGNYAVSPRRAVTSVP